MRLDADRRWSARRLPPASLFALATLAVSAAAWLATWLARWPHRERLAHPMFDRLFAFYDNWGAALAVAIVLLVWCSPALRRSGGRLARLLGERPGATALVTLLVLALGARFAYHAHALAMDESAPLAQAYAFAQGRLSWFLPPELLERMVPLPFRGYFLALDPLTGETASMYWPGFALLLTPFAWAGVPWLLNPLLAAASVLLVHALAVRIIGTREAAGWALLFTLGSPVFAVNGISFYSMPAHLAANLLYALLLLDPRPARAFAAGLVGGLALVLHNPVPHLLFAAPWIVWLLLDRDRWPAVAALFAGYLPIGLLVGAGWPAVIAHLRPAAEQAQPVAVRGLLAARNLFEWPGYQTVLVRLTGTWKLWLWNVPGLLLLSLGGLRGARGPLALFAASALLTYVLYWFVPLDQGHGWGYRYLHSAWAALPLLAAAMISRRGSDSADDRGWRDWAGGLALASLVLATGLRFWQAQAILGEHLAQIPPTPADGQWVVFVSAQQGLYSWDAIQNFPGQGRVITLMSESAEDDARLMAGHFPGATLALADARGSLWRRP